MTTVIDGVGQAISDETRDGSDETVHCSHEGGDRGETSAGQGQSRGGCLHTLR